MVRDKRPVGRGSRADKAVGMFPDNKKKNNLWEFLRKDERGSFPQVWLTVIVCIFSLSLIYVSFYKLICITLFDMCMFYGADVDTTNLIITMFKLFPVMYMASVLFWGIIWSIKREGDPFLEASGRW
jgi:hypothetical protein